MRPAVVAVVGPTATGKSALGIALAHACGGEIINCDSTAVYRGFDIGTDKVAVEAREGVPHHLIDIVDPAEVYTAARFASDAALLIREIHHRGRVPILVGGSGLYYQALTRGLFPGPPADDTLRARLDRVAARRGVEALHRWLGHVDPAAAARILPRDQKRLVRALEVYRLTGRPLTAHFADTVSPIAGLPVVTIGVRIDPALAEARIAARVEAQFARGIVAEVEGLLAAGVSPAARPFGGLVYRQIMEMRAGVRDEAATRALIVQENRRYARRQLIWFRKEPNLSWLEGPGERPAVLEQALALLAEAGISREGQAH